MFAYLVDEITFPSTLQEIGNNAFSICMSLKGLELPEGLHTIGNNAFGMLEDSWPVRPPKETNRVYIPASVQYIGENAFDVLRLRHFEVAAGNPFYASLDGALTNASQDAILQPYSDGSGVYYVPEGIRTISWEMTRFLDVFKSEELLQYHFILPSSVTDFPVEPYDGDKPLVFHCPSDSPAEASGYILFRSQR